MCIKGFTVAATLMQIWLGASGNMDCSFGLSEPTTPTFARSVEVMLSRYFRSARVLLLGSYGALEEPPYELFAALSRPLLTFTHELQDTGIEEWIDDSGSLENTTDDVPGSSSNANLFILPEHSEIGVVLIFSTVRQLLGYCADPHPLHARERYVHGNYLIIIEQEGVSLERLRASVSGLWRHNSILNLVVTLGPLSWLVDGEWKLYFANPFHTRVEDQLVEWKVLEVERHFPSSTEKINIFNGIPIRCTVFPRNPTLLLWDNLPESFRNEPYVRQSVRASNGSGGLDGMLLGNLASALNFTAETKDASDGLEYGYRLANNTFVGSLGDLLQYRTDVSFNVRFMKHYDTNEVEFLHPIYSDQLCVLSPKSLEIPQWLAIFLCFHPYVWVVFVLTGFAGGYCWYGMRRWALRKVHHYGDRPMKGDRDRCAVVAIELWLVVLGASSTHLPVRLIERLLLLAFLVANVIISGTFQGTLTTAFSTKSYYKDINTLEALDRSGMPIGTSSRSLLDIFGNDTRSALYRSLKGKLKIRNDSARHRAAFQRDTCCIERHSDVHLIINTEYIRPNGQPMLHVIDECPRVYSLAYIVRKGWPFSPLFNAAIYRFVEAGLCMKWYGDTEDALTLRERVRQMRQRDDEPTLRKLTIVDMQTSFYIIVLGVASSWVVFVIELFIGKGE